MPQVGGCRWRDGGAWATLVDMKTRHPWSPVSAVVAAMLTASACTGNHDSPAGPERATTEPAATSPAPSTTPVSTAGPIELSRADAKLEVSIEQLRGGVDRTERARLRAAISEPIARWINAAFHSGGDPNSDLDAAFAGWTPRAAALAREHRDVTTNAALGANLSRVIIDKRRVRLFVFATDGVVGGATAGVTLRVAGVQPAGSETRFSVEGELYLTRDGSQWQIFGYSLQRQEEQR